MSAHENWSGSYLSYEAIVIDIKKTTNSKILVIDIFVSCRFNLTLFIPKSILYLSIMRYAKKKKKIMI